MNNNQYYGGQYPQQSMNNYQQPMYNYQQPMYNQTVYGPPMSKKSNGCLIAILIMVGIVLVFGGIIAFFIMNYFKAYDKAKGEWECTSTDGSATISVNIKDDNTLEEIITTGGQTVTVNAKYENEPSLYDEDDKKKGYTYISFRLSDGKATSEGMEIEVGEDKGFTFGINGDEAHYITGDGSSSTSKRYTCKRK